MRGLLELEEIAPDATTAATSCLVDERRYGRAEPRDVWPIT